MLTWTTFKLVRSDAIDATRGSRAMNRRLRLPALTCAAALLVAPAHARAKTISVAERFVAAGSQFYDDRAPADATHEFTLTLVHFSGGAWPRRELLAAVRQAAALLTQCRIVLRRVEIVLVNAPARYRALDTPTSRELARRLRLPKPTVFFVDDTRHEPAFDAEAIGRGNSQSRPELADTAWITRAARDAGLALAHELVHVLSDSGTHTDSPLNLMNPDTNPEHTRLSAVQCARIRDVGTVNGLLTQGRSPPAGDNDTQLKGTSKNWYSPQRRKGRKEEIRGLSRKPLRSLRLCGEK
jgi:hypothetical protein